MSAYHRASVTSPLTNLQIRKLPAPVPAGSSARELYDGLDGYALSILGRVWLIEVYGISDTGGRRWVQVGLASDNESHMATLCVPPGAGLQHVVMNLASWLQLGGDERASRVVLNVA